MTVLMNPVPRYLAHVLMNPGVNAELRFRPKRIVHGNPGEYGDRDKKSPLTAVLMIGLTMSRFPKKKGKLQKATPKAIRKFFMNHLPSGGSVILQLGWWARAPEDSVKVVIENSDTGLTDIKFMDRVAAASVSAIEKFGQYEIWVDFFRGARRTGKPKRAYWES